jgi:CBS domain-containing protein
LSNEKVGKQQWRVRGNYKYGNNSDGSKKMSLKIVSDIMVPLSGYPTVSTEATLKDAVEALEKAQKKLDATRYRHRAVLVFDANKKIVGKVSQLDVLKALEPKYDQMNDSRSLNRFGFSREFMKSLFKQFKLLDKPLDDIGKKAGRLKVKEIMYTPSDGEFVEETATINEAIHQLVLGNHQSLLVTKAGEIVGILRQTDVFKEVYNAIVS